MLTKIIYISLSEIFPILLFLDESLRKIIFNLIPITTGYIGFMLIVFGNNLYDFSLIQLWIITLMTLLIITVPIEVKSQQEKVNYHLVTYRSVIKVLSHEIAAVAFIYPLLYVVAVHYIIIV